MIDSISTSYEIISNYLVITGVCLSLRQILIVNYFIKSTTIYTCEEHFVDLFNISRKLNEFKQWKICI